LKKKELVYKPNQTIMITNREITATQRKAYNIILFEAQNELKNNPNQVLFNFEISKLKQRAGIKASDNWHLKKDIKKLRNIEVEVVKDNGDWSIFGLISYADKNDELLEVELPKPIREALIKNDYYTTLDLLIIKELQGKYAIILYEIAMRYQKKEIPKFTIEEFKELTGTSEIKSYNDFSLLRKKVIETAITEINEKTDLEIDYKIKKRGRKVIEIKFSLIKKKRKVVIIDLEIEETENEELKELINMLPEEEKNTEIKKEKWIKKLEIALKEHSYNAISDDILYSKGNADDFESFFANSIKSGHWGLGYQEKLKAKEVEQNLKKENEEKLKKEIENKKKREAEEQKRIEEETVKLDLLYKEQSEQEKEEIYNFALELMKKDGHNMANKKVLQIMFNTAYKYKAMNEIEKI